MAVGSKAALACIDVQEDFCDNPDGALAVKGARALAPIWNELLSLPFAVKLATRDYHPRDHISFASQHKGRQPFTSTLEVKNPENEQDAFTTTLWPDHCVQGTPGCEYISHLDLSKLTHSIEKGQDKRVEMYSGFGPPYRNPKFGMTGMEEELKKEGITDLFVVGLAFEYCVKYTAIDAVACGFRTFVVEDGTKAVDQSEQNLAAVRKELQDKGVVLIILDSPELEKMKNS
ncbi:NAD(+) salvage pathway protein [Vermiconidia calcicola]|uniref:NAD(+) salvage pathway protein n=1 Tax=Vermiconidia calcicola TaxID=1690605 RepID=A0ACC3P1S7_9PEZI|nr:NAD(+) salvage pathway protein [Vermiconidia calcicola]